jgi:hypothetical protein
MAATPKWDDPEKAVVKRPRRELQMSAVELKRKFRNFPAAMLQQRIAAGN